MKWRLKSTNVTSMSSVVSLSWGFGVWKFLILWISVYLKNPLLCSFFVFFSPQAGAWVQSHVLCFWETYCCYVDMVHHVHMYTYSSLFPVSTLGQRLSQDFSSSGLFFHTLLPFCGLPDWSSRYRTAICCVSIYTTTSFPVHRYTWTGKILSVPSAMICLVSNNNSVTFVYWINFHIWFFRLLIIKLKC